MKLKLVFSTLVILILSSICLGGYANAVAASDWRPGDIIDDYIFTDKNSMSIVDIQNFLNQKVGTNTYGSAGQCDTNGTKNSELGGGTRAQFGAAHNNPVPFTCLKDYYEVPKLTAGPGMPANNYGGVAIPPGAKSAANLIYDAAQQYNISPKVLLVTIQKESVGPLVTDDWPFKSQYTYAMGAHCPDSGPGGTANCDPNYSGFSIQISESAALFRYYLDNMSQPWWPYKKLGNNAIQYSPNTSCGSTTVDIQSTATAALYTYTPYQPNQAALDNLYGSGDSCSAYGNRNFWRMYNDWFGSTQSGRCFYGYTDGLVHTSLSFRKVHKNQDSGNYTIYSGSQSGCVETHVWNYNFSNWDNHNSSNLASINPTDGVIKYADLNGDGIDEPILVSLKNTASGMVEFRVWNDDMKTWITSAVSNLSTTSLTGMSIEFVDLNGDGKDVPIAIGTTGTTTGMVEFHVWGKSVTEWSNHIVTNLPVLDPLKMQLGFAKLDGSGPDEAIAMGIAGTSTGNIEFHVWNPGFASWRSHIVTNSAGINPANSSILFGDIENKGVENAVLVGAKNTASGMVEFHVWKSGLHEWKFHSTSNINALP